jgi:integrase/recombinase XerD
MVTLCLVLDKRRATKDGKYPLLFRIGAYRKYAHISAGFHLHPSQFNEINKSINDADIHVAVKLLESKYLKQIFSLKHERNLTLNASEIKEMLLGNNANEVTIKSFWDEHIKSLEISRRFGGARTSKASLNALEKHSNLNVQFCKFSYRDLLMLESCLYKSGVSTNGIGVYMRSFRAICNKAINMDIVSYEWYPFRKYKIKKEKTSPRTLSMSELQSYFSLNVPSNHPHYRSWLIGKLIFMLRGINITDLLLLSSDNIKRDRIIYKRSKTGKLYSIRMTKEITCLLKLFNPTQTLLGVIPDKDLQKGSQLIDIITQKRKVINNHLRCLGLMIAANESISTYVFRYSYANIAKQLGYSKDLIAEALGHEYGNSVTGIYLEQFDAELIDQMNAHITDAVIVS